LPAFAPRQSAFYTFSLALRLGGMRMRMRAAIIAAGSRRRAWTDHWSCCVCKWKMAPPYQASARALRHGGGAVRNHTEQVPVASAHCNTPLRCHLPLSLSPTARDRKRRAAA